MEGRAEEQHGVSGPDLRHDRERLGQIAGILVVVAARPQPSAAVLLGERIDRPHDVKEVFEAALGPGPHILVRSEEHTSELQSLMRISYAVFCLKNKT